MLHSISIVKQFILFKIAVGICYESSNILFTRFFLFRMLKLLNNTGKAQLGPYFAFNSKLL